MGRFSITCHSFNLYVVSATSFRTYSTLCQLLLMIKNMNIQNHLSTSEAKSTLQSLLKMRSFITSPKLDISLESLNIGCKRPEQLQHSSVALTPNPPAENIFSNLIRKRCVHTICVYNLEDKISGIKLFSKCDIGGIEAFLMPQQLHWAGQVVRTRDGMISKIQPTL